MPLLVHYPLRRHVLGMLSTPFNLKLYHSYFTGKLTYMKPHVNCCRLCQVHCSPPL